MIFVRVALTILSNSCGRRDDQARRIWLTAIVIMASAVVASGVTFTYTPFPIPNLPNVSFGRGGINDNGQIVIWGGSSKSLRLPDGTVSEIPPEPGYNLFSIMYAINNVGPIVGQAANQDHGM